MNEQKMYFDSVGRQMARIQELIGDDQGSPKKLDPDCKYCEGRGIMYVPNGPDDYDSEECICMK